MLTFNLKKEWFDKIKNGEKTHEYRECKSYWTKRLLKYSNEIFAERKSFIYSGGCLPNIRMICCFKNGYPKNDDKKNILYAEILSITETNGKNTDLAIDKVVYDIEFELIKEQTNE